MTLFFRYYKAAAEQGDPDALNNLGVCYHTGHATDVPAPPTPTTFALSATDSVCRDPRTQWKARCGEGSPSSSFLVQTSCWQGPLLLPDADHHRINSHAIAQGHRDAQHNLELASRVTFLPPPCFLLPLPSPPARFPSLVCVPHHGVGVSRNWSSKLDTAEMDRSRKPKQQMLAPQTDY